MTQMIRYSNTIYRAVLHGFLKPVKDVFLFLCGLAESG